MSEDFWWKKAGVFYQFAGRSAFVRNIHKAFLEQVDDIKLKKGINILDAGCGDGNITFPLAERGFNITAIDFGESVLEQAEKKRQKKNISNIHFEFGDLNNPLKYEKESFGLVTSLHVIMKVKNYGLALSEFYRVLKKGGYLVISTTSSNEEFTPWFLRYIKQKGVFKAFWDARWLIAWGIPYCLMTKRSDRRNEWRWTTQDLKTHAEDAGFKTVKTLDVPYTHVGCSLGVFIKE